MPLKAILNISTALRDDKTCLHHCYHTTPFKVLNITEDKRQRCLDLIIMSSSPGILDGDEYNWDIQVAEGCHLSLKTQSYQRLFKMQFGATQHTKVVLATNASLSYIPHPTVPQEQSIFFAQINIFLTTGCSLVWGEVITCGRKLSEEFFRLSRFQSITNIFFDGRLVLKENLLLSPGVTNLKGIGQLEGYSHQGSLIHLQAAEDLKKIMDDIIDLLNGFDQITFGISRLQINGFIVRILGCEGELLYDLLQQIGALCNKNAHDTLHVKPTQLLHGT